MSSSRHKRSSILKKRPSVDPASLEGSPSETTTTSKVTKRIGFKPKKSVKEFFASEETATIWCNSYEVSADGTPPCLVVADVSTIKDASKIDCAPGSTKTDSCQTNNKENRLSAEELRASFGDSSSIWNLSISVSEEERRRLKAENSVLNTTDKLTQDPVSLPRPVLRQKQLEVQEDSSAMDISPVKSDGNMASPKKILYHHPKQNMFITIANENRPSVASPNDSEINFFGPPPGGSQPAQKQSQPAKILFQTSNINNQWRNKSIQTEPRASMVGNMRSTAVNADLSADGWSSHVAATEPFGQHRYTFGTSQFEISEAWNSHPAAALKLKMLQQGKISAQFDPRLSDDGGGEGGGGGEDIDSTLAITQTVAKMLGPGSRPVSLENTRVMESEPMDVTTNKENHPDEPMDTSANVMDLAEDATVSDVRIPTNALSRARPSFVPSATPMDESVSQSPEQIVSVSGHRRKSKQRATLLETVPIENIQVERDGSLLNPGPSHEPSPKISISSGNRKTIVHHEKIIEDDPFLGVPQLEVKTPPKSNTRKTVYNSNMDQSPVAEHVDKRGQTPMFMVEPIKLDLPELIFGENSIGLELTKYNETEQHEVNRPKIHRMPPRNLKLEFGTIKSVEKPTKPDDHVSTIVIDSPDPKVHEEPNRRTVNVVANISLDNELLDDGSDSNPLPSRKTNFQNLDVSVEKAAEDKPDVKRVTVFTNEKLDESDCQPKELAKPPRGTIFCNDDLEQTAVESCAPRGPLESQSGSLEDIRSNNRKTILRKDDAMECLSPDSEPVGRRSKDSRATNFILGEMDQSRSGDSVVKPNLRLTTAAVQDMDETVCQSPKKKSIEQPGIVTRKTDFHNLDVSVDSPVGAQPANVQETISVSQSAPKSLRPTILFNQQLDQTRLEPRSGSLEDLRNYGLSRRTSSARKTSYLLGEMDQTRTDEKVVDPKSRMISTLVQEMDETASRSPIVTAAVPSESGKHRGTTSFNLDMDQSSCSRKSVVQDAPKQKSRQTIIARESMEQTLVDREVSQQMPQRISVVHPKTRQTITGRQSMDETLIDRHVELQEGPQALLEANMDETGADVEIVQRSGPISRESGVVSQKSRHTSYYVTSMEETKVHQMEKDDRDSDSSVDKSDHRIETRQSVLTEMNMDETAFKSHTTTNISRFHIDETIRQSPIQPEFISNKTVESRHTSYATKKMDETLSPTVKLESIILEKSKLCADNTEPSLSKQRPSTYQEQAMDETGYETPPENLPLPPRGSIIRSSITIPKSSPQMDRLPGRQTTIYQKDPMDETTHDLQKTRAAAEEICVQSPPVVVHSTEVDQLRRTLGMDQDMDRSTAEMCHTFYNQRNMELTAAAAGVSVKMDEFGQLADEDVSTEADAVPVDSQKTAEQRKSGIVCKANISLNHHNPPAGMSKPNRQTILVPEDMDQSLEMDTTGDICVPERSQATRRTIIHPDNIAEESARYSIKLELEESTLNVAVSPTFVLQEQTKQDFSFAVPQLPDDCVLRSAAPMPAYKSNPTSQHAPQLAQPEFANYSITDPGASSIRKTINVDNLSEISGLELSNLQSTRPLGRVTLPPPGDVCSLTLKEVPEPMIAQPAPVPVSVIQETPKKASLIPIRKNRGSIFDRQSMDLDESGIAPILSQEQIEQSEPSRDLPVVSMTKILDALPPVVSDDEIVVKNEPVVESSDDEFYDANQDPETQQNDDHVDQVYVTKEAVHRSGLPGRGNLKFVEVNDKDQTQITMIHNQTTSAECRTLKFIDIDDLEQTTQKRQLSRISKSVLMELEDDPLNVSLSDDYPMKKRKTKIPTPIKRSTVASPVASEQKSMRRVTFHQDVVDPDENEKRSELDVTNLPEVETVTIKEECLTINVDEDEQTKIGQTILTDPSVFIIDESDMLANESNISFIGSPPPEHNNRGSTLKFDNTYYQEYVNLTLHVNQTTNSSCIIISDDSVTVANHNNGQNSNTPPLERRLTMEDLPERIKRTRESLVMNSTVASEVMYELNQQITEAKKTCCSFQGNCNCRHRRTMAVVKRENVEKVRETWNQNFDRILGSVSDLPVHSLPLDDRISEVLSRPMRPLPLPCLEKRKPHLPEVPSIRFLCENYLTSHKADHKLSTECSPCDLPATPSVTALLCNKLQTERFRWFLDTSEEHRMCLYLRHRVLRSIRFKIQLQSSRRWYSKAEDTRIVRIECIETPSDLVDSPRLQLAHSEVVRVMHKTAVDLLSSQYPTTAHIMGLIVHIDTTVEQIFGKVDQLYRIVRNNGAILEPFGDGTRHQIDKFYEYQHDGAVHWNRIYVQFESIDRIDHHSVIFHRKMINAACLLPTEQQCGKIPIQGLTFLECLLWNVEKMSIS
ncbi:uncharacterized protein LOC109400001 [Aedes albopictus]|uniref:Uncharacterized protein n=1 Tax=Aedes albopictus TaxID=7160 RepID=A0ABM1Z308_AEDAL